MSKLRKLEEKEIDARVKNEALKEECEMKSKRLDLLHCNLHKNSQDMSDLLSNVSTVSINGILKYDLFNLIIYYNIAREKYIFLPNAVKFIYGKLVKFEFRFEFVDSEEYGAK